ncbi:hypothetical protein CH063_06810 [Colletotrichum higginsianum]|uniref:Uncharacterized protein n=1 Tax=Colletotrichum higginsianum (strain IMI 349063) TaxID=759273 RepID=H1V3V1_COLHI|nr:hypothetical protein CH063_06810 [Colletotrichum higginsianum]
MRRSDFNAAQLLGNFLIYKHMCSGNRSSTLPFRPMMTGLGECLDSEDCPLGQPLRPSRPGHSIAVLPRPRSRAETSQIQTDNAGFQGKEVLQFVYRTRYLSRAERSKTQKRRGKDAQEDN